MKRFLFPIVCSLIMLPQSLSAHVESHDKSMRMLMIQTLLEIKMAIEFVPEKAKLAHQNDNNQSLFKQKGVRLSRWMSESPNIRMFQGADPVLVRMGYQVRDIKVELKENLKHIVDKGFCHEVVGWEKDPYFKEANIKIDKLIMDLQKMPAPISNHELKDLKHKVEQQFVPVVLF